MFYQLFIEMWMKQFPRTKVTCKSSLDQKCSDQLPNVVCILQELNQKIQMITFSIEVF